MEESTLRLSIFVGGLALFAIAEALLPRRKRRLSRLARWPNNLGLVFLNSLLLRIIFPAAAVGAAAFAAEHDWGVLNLVEMTDLLKLIIAVLLLDCAIYTQHVVFHKIPIAWRLHRVHHTDPDLDVTSGLRFHPVEIVLSMVIKWGVILLLGAPALAVIIFEIMLNFGAMFNHSNLKLPLGLDRTLRMLIVTPDMHRVHHSTIRTETDSNYGFNLSIWDRLFRTYTKEPELGHDDMQIGVAGFEAEQSWRIDHLLMQPMQPTQRRK